ncbi:phosphodiesterase [Terrisporobacter mayombei]|nr:phosphodiesterase [Terrisporobacter mayombei]
MKIGVMSDTHGSLLYLEKALDVLSDCDILLHIGDVLYHGPRNDLPEGYNPKAVVEKINSLDNITIVKGNCDADVDQMVINHAIEGPFVHKKIDNISVLMYHGYTLSREEMMAQARELGVDILILGHTHIKELNVDKDLIVLNPGSTSIPKDGSHSVATIELLNDENTEDEFELEIDLIDINTKEIIEFE